MKKILHLHPSFIIGLLAFIFAAMLIAFYSWAINDVFTELRLALVPPVPQSVTGFNLAGASQLDLHGVAASSSAPAAASTTE